MSLIHLIVLALVQGITEFLPISSSAHLVLVPFVLDENDQGRLIDVAAHVGTLAAVMIYFRGDLWLMIRGGLKILTGDFKDPGARLALLVVAATIPVIIVGFILNSLSPEWLRSPELIAWTTLIFALVLWWADSKGRKEHALEDLSWRNALLIGLAQILALFPGTSRSGITMTAGRALGFTRVEAARFSLLLGMPAIAGAGTLATLDLIESGDMALTVDAAVVAVLSCVSALAAIALMMRWLKSATFLPFVIYRLGLAAVLMAWLYF